MQLIITYLYLGMYLLEKDVQNAIKIPLIVIISFVSSNSVMINNGLNDSEQTNPKLIQGIDSLQAYHKS